MSRAYADGLPAQACFWSKCTARMTGPPLHACCNPLLPDAVMHRMHDALCTGRRQHESEHHFAASDFPISDIWINRCWLLTQGSDRYSARLVAALQQQAGKESKYKKAAHDAEVKRQQTQVTRVQAAQRLAALQKRTAAVKLEAESALCKALDRQVNIQGEINNVL